MDLFLQDLLQKSNATDASGNVILSDFGVHMQQNVILSDFGVHMQQKVNISIASNQVCSEIKGKQCKVDMMDCVSTTGSIL